MPRVVRVSLTMKIFPVRSSVYACVRLRASIDPELRFCRQKCVRALGMAIGFFFMGIWFFLWELVVFLMGIGFFFHALGMGIGCIFDGNWLFF